MYLVLLLVSFGHVSANAIDLLDVSSLEPVSPNYCNDRFVRIFEIVSSHLKMQMQWVVRKLDVEDAN